MKKPSKLQREILKALVTSGKPLRQIYGGFRITGDVTVPIFEQPPEPYCYIRTVRALEKHGWLERANRFPGEWEEWRDDRIITFDGKAAVFQL